MKIFSKKRVFKNKSSSPLKGLLFFLFLISNQLLQGKELTMHKFNEPVQIELHQSAEFENGLKLRLEYFANPATKWKRIKFSPSEILQLHISLFNPQETYKRSDLLTFEVQLKNVSKDTIMIPIFDLCEFLVF